MKQNNTVPAFLSKLWTLVEDHSTNDLICWSQDGCSFLVREEQKFCKEVLPLYFKHSNMTSFVRQLNMYGFHKVVHVDTGLPRDNCQNDCVEFQHPNFRRSQPHLLSLIRRKVSVSRGGDDGSQLTQVLVEVGNMKSWQDSSEFKLMALCRDNESLWTELDNLRQKQQQQHKVIRKVIHFIVTTVRSSGIKGLKRKLPMIDRLGVSHSAPKYSRTISIDSEQNPSSLLEIPLESSADVYSNGMIISDITHLLEPQPKHSESSKDQSSDSLSTSLSSLLSHTSPAVSSVELALSLLEDPVSQETEEKLPERSEVTDPLTLIDSSLEAINSSRPPSPSLDFLTELFKPGCCATASKDSETDTQNRKRGAERGASTQQHKQTVAKINPMLQEVVEEEEEEEVEEDGGECTDILPSLLQLAQEASEFSYNPIATLPETAFLL